MRFLKLTVFAVSLFLPFCAQHETLEVSIYYEALCPYSRSFITRKVVPAYEKLDKSLNLHLIPFGNTKISHEGNKFSFKCHHGPNECTANKMQACVLHKHLNESSKFAFINCILRKSNPASMKNGNYCATESNIEWRPIQLCLDNGEADDILLDYGTKTLELRPKLKYVPHVRFNGDFNKPLETKARHDFFETVCDLFSVKPAVCINNKNDHALDVGVYYESLCPASVQFITTQLYPSYSKIGDYINLDLVPFGKATADNSSGEWKFTCQHGPLECYNNKIHSCVIASNPLASSVEFINCAMSSNTPSNASLENCAQETHVSWPSIQSCLTSGRANELLAQNGEKTEEVEPRIAYVPTITFNNFYNESEDDEAQEHFLKTVCSLLDEKPVICTFYDIFLNIIL